MPFENDVYQAGFDASWEIDVFGGKRRATEAAKDEVAAIEFGRRATLLTLLGDVARNYIDVRGYQRQLAIARENIQAQATSPGHHARSFYQRPDQRPRCATGRHIARHHQGGNSLPENVRSRLPFIALGFCSANRPACCWRNCQRPRPFRPRRRKFRWVCLRNCCCAGRMCGRPNGNSRPRPRNIGVAQADLFPKFYLTGLGGFESISASDWFTAGSRFWSVGPTVQWKIFDAGRIRANIKVQNARQEQALAAYEKTVLTAFEDVENGLVAYANEQIRRQSLENAVVSSRQSLALANKLYTNGLTDFVNVLEAERSLYQAQAALVQSDRTVSTDVVALYKSLGGGWETVEKPTSLSLAQTTSSSN